MDDFLCVLSGEIKRENRQKINKGLKNNFIILNMVHTLNERK